MLNIYIVKIRKKRLNLHFALKEFKYVRSRIMFSFSICIQLLIVIRKCFYCSLDINRMNTYRLY